MARLGLCRGESVLDVACGPGSSALPAIEQVGTGGRVIALDVAENPLAIAHTGTSTHAFGGRFVTRPVFGPLPLN